MICPYCGGEISKDNMLLYFADDGERGIVNMIQSIKQISTAIQLHNMENGKYVDYWKHRNDKVKGEPGIVVDPKELLNAIGKEKNNAFSTKDADAGEREIRIHLEPDNPKNTYFRLVGDTTIIPSAYLCPDCWNFFPMNYFDYDNYTVLLIAPTSTGKSVLCASMLANSCQRLLGSSIPNNEERINAVSNYIKQETIQREWMKAVEDFQWNTVGRRILHKLPEGTNNVPPVFFTFTLNFPGQEKYTFNLALVDTKGEGWLKDDSGVTTFLGKCDGVLYLCEPGQSTTLIELTNKNPMEAGYAPEGMPEIGEQDQSPDMEEHARISAGSIFDRYFLTANTVVNHDTPIAFVMTKFDQLLDGEQKKFRFQDDCKPAFFEQLETFHDPRMRNKLLDSSELLLHNIAATSLFKSIFGELNINNGTFRNVNCFCVSSFTGKPNNDMLTDEQFNKPYNIHMPLLWLISQMLSKRNDKEDIRRSDRNPGSPARGTRDDGRNSVQSGFVQPPKGGFTSNQVKELFDDD